MSDIVPMPEQRPMFSIASQYYTSLDKDNLAHKKLIMDCLNNPDERLKQVINSEIVVENIFAHVVEIADDETGEIKLCPRCVLISPDFNTYHCVSEGVYRDLSTLIWLYDKPPWNPPLRLRPKLIELKGGKNMLKLELVDDAKPSKSKRVS